MTKRSEGQDAAIPCFSLALWSLNIIRLIPNSLPSVLSAGVF